ncbi:hypothetical protein RJG79_00575 [Mycoplasmatota bacterium WC44]
MKDDNRDKKKLDKLKESTKKTVTRRIVINLSSNYSKNNFVNYLIKLLINIVFFIIIIVNSNIATFASIYDIVIFAMWFSLFENILVQIVGVRFSKYIVMSFGAILLFPVIIAMVLGYISVQGYIIFRTTDMFLGFVIVFMTSRKIFTTLLLNFIQRRRFNKILKDKGEF